MAISLSTLESELELLNGTSLFIVSPLSLIQNNNKCQSRPVEMAQMDLSMSRKTYMSVKGCIVSKATLPPYNMTCDNVLEILSDCYELVKLHEDEVQKLTREDILYATELFCWESIFRNSNCPFPGQRPKNPSRTVVACPGCFWLEQRKIDCPFIRVLFCRNPGHGVYRVEFGPGDEPGCPKCTEEKHELDNPPSPKEKFATYKRWRAKIKGKLMAVKGKDNGNSNRPFSFCMRPVGMMAPYVQAPEEDWELI